MNELNATFHEGVARARIAALVAVMLLPAACNRVASTRDGAAPDPREPPAAVEASRPGVQNKDAVKGKSAEARDGSNEGTAEGISLKPAEVASLGIVTTEARAMQRSPEKSGFGVVVPHEAMAQAIAELRTALAATHQSHSALERSKRLAGTPGAMPADAQESTERQAVADEAALELARQRLLTILGQHPPWKRPESSPDLLALASGRSKLVRVTFPLGSLADVTPRTVRLTRIDTVPGRPSWTSQTVWRAPADATVPGNSYFAVLRDSEVSEGDHLLAWTPIGEPEVGVVVPASAAVITAGKFYCYIEEKPGTFVRMEFDPWRAAAEGYFVTGKGITAGDKIVTAAAGQLLARELNPSKEAE